MGEERAAGKITNPSGTERLHEYWVHGEGAAKIGWGTPGDFDRCVLYLGKFLRDPKGYCNLAHHAALGIYPAQHAEMIKKATGRSAVAAKEPYGNVSYGDPGYLDADGNQASKSGKPGVKRYPLTADKVMAAWTYINQQKNARQYTATQLSAIKGRIRSAMKQHGHQVSDMAGSGMGRSAIDDAERRYTPGVVEARAAADGQRIGGYAIVFNKLSRNLGGFVERSVPSVVNQSKSLGWPNVVCRYNHDSNMVLGTTGGGTLNLQPDGTGLDYDVLPPQARADILELVTRRDIRFSSYAFRVPAGGDEWGVTDQNYPMRTLHEVQLIDVAPVLDPAYPDATAGLRSLAAAMDAPFDDVSALAAEDELRKFFVRTDNRGPAPKPKITGAMAMMKLMEKRFPDIG